MAFEANGGAMSPADVAAVMGNNGNGFGFGGDGAWWLLVLFLFAFNGNNGWGNGGGMPYVDGTIQRGFDQSAVMAGINGLNTTIANGFADAAVAGCNQTTNFLQGINSLQNTMMQNEMNRQVCCCDNKAAIADLKYTVATEACSDRQAINDALNSIVNTMNAGFQSLKDIEFQQQLDSVRRENETLKMQNYISTLQASQAGQTAELIADNTAQTQYIVNRVAPYPIPSYNVANPFVGNAYSTCGCTA